MSFKDARKLIRNSINVLRGAKNNSLVVVTKDLEAKMKKRIFQRGQTASGGKIGKYSKKPMYVSLEGAKKQYGSQISQGGLRGQGKPDKKGKFKKGVKSINISTGKANKSKSFFKNGKPRASMYFATGYSGFRQAVGRQNSYVDLHLTGGTEKAIQTGKRGNRVVLGFVSNRSFTLAEILEKKYDNKNIFSPSKAEERNTRNEFLKEVVRNLDKVVR